MKKNLKRTMGLMGSCVLLAGAMIMGLCACGSKGSGKSRRDDDDDRDHDSRTERTEDDDDDFELRESLDNIRGTSCIFVDELDRMPKRLSPVLMRELLKGKVIAVAHSTNNIEPAILNKFSVYEMDPGYSIFEDIILRTIAICDNV